MQTQTIFQQQRTATNQLNPKFGTQTTGFVSPATDYLEEPLNIFKTIVTNEVATFYAKIEGNRLQGFGLHNGDYVIIDKSRTVKHNSFVAYFINDDWTVLRAMLRNGKLTLYTVNHTRIEINEQDNHRMFGVIIGNLNLVD